MRQHHDGRWDGEESEGYRALTAHAASASALTWGVISLIKFRRRIDPIFLLNGTLVGLAGITPASGYIEVWAAVVLGFILVSGWRFFFSL